MLFDMPKGDIPPWYKLNEVQKVSVDTFSPESRAIVCKSPALATKYQKSLY